MRFRYRGLWSFSPGQLDQRVKAGLVGHWIGSGSGATLLDYSGLSNHATLAGDARWSLGRENKASVIQLDGTGDYAETAATTTGSSLSAFGTAISMACWVWSNADTGAAQMFICKPVSAVAHTNPYFSYSLHAVDAGSGGYFRMAIDTTGTATFSEAANCVTSSGIKIINYGQWMHVAGTYDGANMRLYVNGLLVNTNAHLLSLIEYATPLRLGTQGGLGEALNGRLEDVRVYNRVLSAAEIMLLSSPDFNVVVPKGSAMLALDSQLDHPRYGDFNFAGF